MKVVCIDDEGLIGKNLILDRIYEVDSDAQISTGNVVVVTPGNHLPAGGAYLIDGIFWRRNRFITLEEYRSRKIDGIIEN